jgi:hypothetical protein
MRPLKQILGAADFQLAQYDDDDDDDNDYLDIDSGRLSPIPRSLIHAIKSI